MKKLLTKRIKAFSLIEMSIVLAIIGVLSVAAINGISMLNDVKLDKQVNSVCAIITAYNMYIQNYGNAPTNENFLNFLKQRKINMESIELRDNTISIKSNQKNKQILCDKLKRKLDDHTITAENEYVNVEIM